MGTVDALAKKYMGRPNVFADLFNHLMYDGEPVLKPESLTEMNTEEIALPFTNDAKSFPVQKYRDVLKNAVIMEDGVAAYVMILGIENQDNVHYAMPVKNMLYDAINYSSQVAEIAKEHKKAHDIVDSAEFLSGMKRDDRLIPVVTLVVYFGQDPWDGPVSLHQMFPRVGEGIMKYVPEYRINLVSPVSMTEEEIDKFKTDFRELAAFIRCGKDTDEMTKLVSNREEFRHMDPLTAEIANRVTESNLKLKINEKGEVDMCVAITGIRERGRAEGLEEGRIKYLEEGRAEGRAEGAEQNKKEITFNLHKMGMDESFIAKAVNVSTDIVKKWLGTSPV